jgi:hypothetical protein
VRKDERLAERLEPPLGPVHTHHDAREDVHRATLSASALADRDRKE